MATRVLQLPRDLWPTELTTAIRSLVEAAVSTSPDWAGVQVSVSRLDGSYLFVDEDIQVDILVND
jgi:hypothetical protein